MCQRRTVQEGIFGFLRRRYSRQIMTSHALSSVAKITHPLTHPRTSPQYLLITHALSYFSTQFTHHSRTSPYNSLITHALTHFFTQLAHHSCAFALLHKIHSSLTHFSIQFIHQLTRLRTSPRLNSSPRSRRASTEACGKMHFQTAAAATQRSQHLHSAVFCWISSTFRRTHQKYR